MPRLLTCAVAALGLLAGPSASAHAAAWLEPVTLAASPAGAPAVAVGPAGDAVAVWEREGRIEARVRAPAAGFADAQQLAPAGSAPDVAVAGDGTAIAVWIQGGSIGYAIRQPGAAFGPSEVLASPGSTPASLQIAMNDRGEALVTYAAGSVFAVLRPAGGNFGAPAPVGDGCAARAALAASGHAAVTWSPCGAPGSIFAARRPPDGPFAAAEGVSPSGEAGTAPAVEVEADGRTTVAWERQGVVRVTSAPAGHRFAEPATVSATDELSAAPALAAAGSDVWLAWRATRGGSARVVAARRPSGAGFGPGETVSPDGVSSGPALRGAPDGSAVAAWLRPLGDDVRIEAARRPPQAPRFDAAVPLSAPGGDAGGADVAADSAGHAAAGYGRDGLPTVHVLDGGAPHFPIVDMRAGGFAKETYEFSVTPGDAWSAVAASSWNFGDGTAKPGPTVTHAFSEPAGTRTVTISATDAAGNVGQVQRQFILGPALDRTPPVFSNVRLDARRFRVSRRETAAVARVRRGTRFRYTLSEPAQVTIFFERRAGGRRRGRTCRPVRSRRSTARRAARVRAAAARLGVRLARSDARTSARRRTRRCTYYEPMGLMTRRHPVAGPVSARFTGRLVARSGLLRLVDTIFRPGRYRATIVAADFSRNVSKRVYRGFTIVR